MHELRKLLMEGTKVFNSYSLHHGCWWPVDDARRQSFSSHSIDLVLSEYSSLSIRRFNLHLAYVMWPVPPFTNMD